jgi:hypothetical protein
MNRESPANSEFEIRKNDEAPAFTKATARHAKIFFASAVSA